ncbi:phosphoinositide 5-phosphatase [Ranunculus cassubicifolius]
MKHPLKKQPEHFWSKAVLRKWLNINNTESDFSADTDDEGDDDADNDSNSDNEEEGTWLQKSRFGNKNTGKDIFDYNEHPSKILRRARRRKSETIRAQYINTKELRISVGTWNVAGKLPDDDLEISEWLDIDEPADIYVIGFQEIVPLNAGNVLGAEDNRPVPRWETIIRETLNRVRPPKTKFKAYSDPPSPSKFKPFDNIIDIEDELINTDSDGDEARLFDETDSEGAGEVHPLDEEYYSLDENEFIDARDEADTSEPKEKNFQRQTSFLKRFDESNSQMQDCIGTSGPAVTYPKRRLTKTYSKPERICLSWPEPPVELLVQKVLERPKSFKAVKSFRASKSFRKSDSFNSRSDRDKEESSEIALLAELDLESIINRKRRSPFIRIASKQMVGVFLSIWARRSLRKHIHNVKVSTVGVGVMGYIGNKGSVSISMSIYQTPFCFICTHLTSGEKYGDEQRRNADVKEILRRTQFHPVAKIGFPRTIHDHERIIWLGDLNYRINLPYEQTRILISRKDWSELVEKDQLIRELKKGRAFDGWTEGALTFPPTYKYEINSDKYRGEDPKCGRRNPAWCDRILYYGKGTRLLKYERVEFMLSDHRPVKAVYMAEVEVFSQKKLQKALAFTDAELQIHDLL